MAELNQISSRMVLVIQCDVKNDKEFRTWAKDRASQYVHDLNEENTISYEWHISDDGSQATLIETFVDSDSMSVRLANHAASPLASEVMDQVNIKSVLCLGNAKDEAKEVLSAWGASFQSYYSGFHKG